VPFAAELYIATPPGGDRNRAKMISAQFDNLGTSLRSKKSRGGMPDRSDRLVRKKHKRTWLTEGVV